MILFVTLFFEWIQGCFNFPIRLIEKKNSKLLDIWHQCYMFSYNILYIKDSWFYFLFKLIHRLS